MLHNYNKIPENTMYSIKNYVEQGIPMGGFLVAVFSNNLVEAVGRADYFNLAVLPEIVSYMYNKCPADCWGNLENIRNWIKKFQRQEEI